MAIAPTSKSKAEPLTHSQDPRSSGGRTAHPAPAAARSERRPPPGPEWGWRSAARGGCPRGAGRRRGRGYQRGFQRRDEGVAGGGVRVERRRAGGLGVCQRRLGRDCCPQAKNRQGGQDEASIFLEAPSFQEGVLSGNFCLACIVQLTRSAGHFALRPPRTAAESAFMSPPLAPADPGSAPSRPPAANTCAASSST